METIDIITTSFQKMAERLDNLDRKLEGQLPKYPLSVTWLDIQETCQLLKISKRTLQAYRDNGILPFSQIGGKIYFRADDIETHLNRHYNKAFKERR